jgi:hypothetical protein
MVLIRSRAFIFIASHLMPSAFTVLNDMVLLLGLRHDATSN